MPKPTFVDASPMAAGFCHLSSPVAGSRAMTTRSWPTTPPYTNESAVLDSAVCTVGSALTQAAGAVVAVGSATLPDPDEEHAATKPTISKGHQRCRAIVRGQ